MWLNVLVGGGTVIGFLISALIITSTVTQNFTQVSAKVDSVSIKVDTASALAQTKVDALTTTVDRNHTDVVLFQSQVTDAFKRIFDSQQKQQEAINQERIDRMTESLKKK